MSVPNILLTGALITTAFFTITAAVIAVAPYIAIGAIIGGIAWSVFQEVKKPTDGVDKPE